ncbi:pilus assembly protein CpaB [Aeromicrobium sp. SORGH_AS981]|uniref:Flp pilus assembly protein CpaB n=1 Tax=Aeromicrobium sp. SORGH_AS_0981 TaxID=3041802 RepID=UPI002856596B|nr:RcpC/CpaB family pilus assembly protein [Aeromicrobium sp. SORGH_AS_0981]MDR6120396.1 pilus assembly protein CpaB [Aeromicrobium sp. SORGH_AS_0981]
MNKQRLAIGAAVLLAVLGFAALVVYAQGADDRAFEGTGRTTVLRVTQEVATKTPASELAKSVETVDLPKAAVVPGALTDLSDVEGEVTQGVLVPGDQLTAAKFASPDDVKGDTAVPKGMQELAIQLEGQRIVGGALAPGDLVGVMASYEGRTANAANRVRVLAVSAGVGDAQVASGATVTVAVRTIDAEKIVNAMEFGKVWLTKQTTDTDTGGGRTVDSRVVAP